MLMRRDGGWPVPWLATEQQGVFGSRVEDTLRGKRDQPAESSATDFVAESRLSLGDPVVEDARRDRLLLFRFECTEHAREARCERLSHLSALASLRVRPVDPG